MVARDVLPFRTRLISGVATSVAQCEISRTHRSIFFSYYERDFTIQ
jgi:hypothetical protein